MNENKPTNPEEIAPDEIVPENDQTPTAPEENDPEVSQELESVGTEAEHGDEPKSAVEIETEVTPAAQLVAEKGKSKKKPLLIAAIVVAAVAIVAIIASAVLSSQPLGILAEGIKNSYEALKSNEIVALSEDIIKGGSIEASADLEPLTESMLGYGIEGNAVLKLYSSDKPAAAAVGSVEIDGEDLLDLTLVMNQEEIAINSTSLLGGNAYGICFENIGKYFDSSVFGPDGNYSIGVEYEEIQEILDSVKNRASTSEEASAIIEDILKTVLKSVSTHAEIEKGRETLSFAGEECKTTTVSIHADALAMLNIAGDFIDYCRTDSKLREFLTENSELLGTIGTYGGYYGIDAEETLDLFYEGLDEVAKEIEDLIADAEDIDTEVDITFYVTKSGSYLVGADLVVEVYEEAVRMEAYIGPDLRNVTEISFRYDDDYDKIKGNYVVKANDAKEYSATLKIKENNEVIFSGKIDWDKDDGDLDIEFVDQWEDAYAFSCEMKHSSKATIIQLISFEDDYEEMDIGVTVTLKSSDKMPTISKYADILVMDEDEVEDIVYDIMDVVSELYYFMY